MTQPKTHSGSLQFIAGGGEMGTLIRDYNWADTPVGAPETWPQSLRTSLSIMLESHFPMYILWGKEHIQFYNNGFRPILGDTKHPAIGLRSEHTFSEIWDSIGPMFQEVMKGNAIGLTDLMQPLNRYGYAEECYFVFSYSPIRDETGDVGGIMVIVTETSERVIEVRRLKTLRDMADRASEVKTIQDAWESIRQTMEENTFDIPYGLCYSIDLTADKAGLMGNVRLEGHPAAWPAVDLNSKDTTVLSSVLQNKKPQLLTNAAEGYGDIIAGAWPEPAVNTYVVPLSWHDKDLPVGVLVFGVSPRKAFDDNYAGFFNLFANHASTAISNALAYEAERERTEALLAIDKSKTAFFSNIRHEFRTPLTLMLGPLEDMLQQTDVALPARIKEDAETSHRNAMRLLRLVNTLLDFSRIESGRVEGRFQPVDLCEFTTNLASNFRSVIEKAGLRFEIHCHNLPYDAYVDKSMWEKIVFNLLSNAFKYTLGGSVTITLEPQGKNAVLKVIDTGVGIPDNELPYMFDRFHRVKNVIGRTYEGTGIGLSLVAELIKLHSGNISVQSSLGNGSTFTVTLPMGKEHLPANQIEDKFADFDSVSSQIYTEEAESLLHAGAEQQTGNEMYEFQKPRVLVADDNADMRTYITTLLGNEYIIETAADGADALQKMTQNRPDLVLSDIMMPGIDGIQLLKLIKENARFANTPVIMLSARAGEESRIEGYEVGADDYLVKPFAAKELLARVKAQIKISKARTHIEQQLKNLFEQAPIAMCIFRGPDYVIEVANERMLELWGKTQAAVLKKPLFDCMPDAAGQGFEQILDKVYQTGERFVGYELPIDLLRHGKMESIFVKFVYEALREEDGTISGIMAMADEITNEVLARKKIEENEERVRMAVQSTHLGTWEYNPATTEVNWSRECELIYGMTEGMFVDIQVIMEHIHPEDKEFAVNAFRKAMDPESTDSYNVVYRILRFDDRTVRWVKMQGKVFFTPEKVAERFIGTVIDITEQKKFEQTLRASEQRTRLAIEAADLGTFDWNLEKSQFFSSTRLLDIFGFKGRPETTHQDLINSFHPDDKPVRDKAVAGAFEKGKLVYEARVIWPDQTIHWVKTHGKVVYNTDKKPLRMYGTVIDVTSQKQQSEELEKKVEERTLELKETIAELARSNSDLEQFAWVASHDLNEPIRMVSTYTSLMARKYRASLPEGAAEYVDFIMEGTTRMQQLIKDLLQYSRIGAAKMPFKEVDLNDVLQNVKITLTDVIAKSGAVVEVGPLPVVKGIETQLTQLFQNLVENGIKFRKNTVQPVIKVSTEDTGNEWEICVADNGIGIAAEYFEKIFIIFQRLHTRDAYNGTGIGLSVCKKIVEVHGGRIWLESEPDHGTSFFFTFPK